MIVTDLNHVEQQVLMTPGLKRAFDFLRRPDVLGFTDGKVEIDGENVFALVQSYETASGNIVKFEHHKKYIDIQHVLAGEEIIGWVPAEQMTITENYDTMRDIGFGTVERERMTPVYLKAGQLAVFFPDDAHAPRLAAHTPSSVLKIVIKVSVGK
ncbi:MAG TPA: YhcH/YjgK/YiaL family protein [Dissulfurispiraceae bacterium]|nr:YhcH/YjgK/YiaL family protein [Dissulfurispiraceae bacterium]